MKHREDDILTNRTKCKIHTTDIYKTHNQYADMQLVFFVLIGPLVIIVQGVFVPSGGG